MHDVEGYEEGSDVFVGDGLALTKWREEIRPGLNIPFGKSDNHVAVVLASRKYRGGIERGGPF